MMAPLIGTCSWNYDSWRDLVYTKTCRTAAEYLEEYATHYPTVEIDSWFYKLPERKEVEAYLARVPESFRFTCKLSNEITLTHLRGRPGQPPVANPGFLSAERFALFLERIEPMLPRIDAVMLEFEYLNRDKMPSQAAFLDRLAAFADAVPRIAPLSVEPRNKAWLNQEYFRLLQSKNLGHVFSEKLYLPPIHELYAAHAELLTDTVVIRLLGGDRQEIEAKTGEQWNAIVEPKTGKERIITMSRDIIRRGKKLVINVNNHYEGSAPLTIQWLRDQLEDPFTQAAL